jgi:hypothetical protein
LRAGMKAVHLVVQKAVRLADQMVELSVET